MADKTLRGLAKDYFDGDYKLETYLQRRNQLIDQITTEAPLVGKPSSTPIVKYAIVAGMMLLVGGALGVFWVLKEPPEQVKSKEVPVPFSEESELQVVPSETESIADAPDVAEQGPPPYAPDQQEESAAGSLDEEKSKAANSDDIDARTVEYEPQFAEKPQNTQEALTEQDKTKLAKLLQECQEHFKARRLVTGNGGTALVCYREVLDIDSDNAGARAGLIAIEQRYKEWAERALDKNRFSRVKTYLERLETVNPQSTVLTDLRQRLEQAER